MVVQWDDEEQGSDRCLGFTFAELELIMRLQLGQKYILEFLQIFFLILKKKKKIFKLFRKIYTVKLRECDSDKYI